MASSVVRPTKAHRSRRRSASNSDSRAIVAIPARSSAGESPPARAASGAPLTRVPRRAARRSVPRATRGPGAPLPPGRPRPRWRRRCRARAPVHVGEDQPPLLLGHPPETCERGPLTGPRPRTWTRTDRAATSSETGCDATTRPRSTIATRSHMRSTSPSRCELRKTVTPRSRRAAMMRRTSWRPTGSRAEVGSSSRTSSGWPRSATPRPRRCCMPFEYVATRSSPRPASPTVSSADSISPRHVPRSSRASSQWRRRTSRPVSQGW